MLNIKKLLLASAITISTTLPAYSMIPNDDPSHRKPVAKKAPGAKAPAKKGPTKAKQAPKAPAKAKAAAKGPIKTTPVKKAPGVKAPTGIKAPGKAPAVKAISAVAPASQREVQVVEVIKPVFTRKINSRLPLTNYVKYFHNDAMITVLFHAVQSKADFRSFSLTCKQMYYMLPRVAFTYRGVYLERVNAEANHPAAVIHPGLPDEFAEYAGFLNPDRTINPVAVASFEEENGPLMRCWLEGRYRHAFGESYHENKQRIQASVGLQSMDNHAQGWWNLGDQALRLLPSNIMSPEIVSACQYLDLTENGLIELPLAVGRLVNLRELELAGNELETLPMTLNGLTQLRKLSLRGNNFRCIPPVVLDLSSLEELVLGSEGSDSNHIEEIPTEITQLTRLQNLICSSNKLKHLPPEIGQVTSLRGIWLDRNGLESVCPELFNLRGLTQLFLHQNKLTSLPRTIGNLTNVTWLYLGGNQLTSIPDEIGSMVSLKKLLLGGNQLKSLCNGVLRLPALEELDVSNNKIVAFPVGFSRMPCLRDLNLSVNPVKNTKVLFADLNKFKGRGTYCHVRYFQKYGLDNGLTFEYTGN